MCSLFDIERWTVFVQFGGRGNQPASVSLALTHWWSLLPGSLSGAPWNCIIRVIGVWCIGNHCDPYPILFSRACLLRLCRVSENKPTDNKQGTTFPCQSFTQLWQNAPRMMESRQLPNWRYFLCVSLDMSLRGGGIKTRSKVSSILWRWTQSSSLLWGRYLPMFWYLPFHLPTSPTALPALEFNRHWVRPSPFQMPLPASFPLPRGGIHR